MNGTGIYGHYWDSYVDRWVDDSEFRRTLAWPGDEWGSSRGWASLFEQLFVAAGVERWERAVEIGQGSGKYTTLVLARSGAIVRAYDVSSRFLHVCRERCAPWLRAGRLSTHLLGTERPAELLADLERCGWRRRLDAFYSIDAMVHVDLQHLVVYLLTAALTLRPGGKLLLTLADATRDPGFRKLLEDIQWTFPAQASPDGSGKFEWLAPDIVRSLLPRLGFELDLLDAQERDLRVVASLADPKLADSLEEYLEPREERYRRELVEATRAAIRQSVPADAVVLVVSRGDDNLLELDSRQGRHFPHVADGVYAGFHPADDDEAIARLEAARTAGAEYLALPSAAFWWLDHYSGLRDHLDRHYRTALADERCVVYDLR